MKKHNIASIIGLVTPSMLCVGWFLTCTFALQDTGSGEVAAVLYWARIAGIPKIMALSCVACIACFFIARHRNEPLWHLPAAGIPFCIPITLLTAIIL